MKKMLLITRRSGKPFFSEKITSKDKITLIEENEIVSNDENKAQVSNIFFSNILGSLNILKFANNDPISDNINDAIIKLIVTYRKHPSYGCWNVAKIIFMWYQSIFPFNKIYLHDIKIYFYSIKINF